MGLWSRVWRLRISRRRRWEDFKSLSFLVVYIFDLFAIVGSDR